MASRSCGLGTPKAISALKAASAADRDKVRHVYDSLAHLKVGEGWILGTRSQLAKAREVSGDHYTRHTENA